MKILKNYKLFVENKNTDKITKNDIINEGIGSKIGDFLSGIMDKIKQKWGKNAWFYKALAIFENGPIVYNEQGKKLAEFYPYSISPDEKMKALDELRKMKSFEEELDDVDKDDVQSQEEVEDELTPVEVQEAYNSLKNEVMDMLNESNDDDNVVGMGHPDPNMREVNADSLKKSLIYKFNLKVGSASGYDDEAAYKKAGGTRQRSMFIWGAPGIGKTQIISQVANELGVDLIVWHLSVVEPADFIGVPGVTKDAEGNKRTVFYLPEIFPTSNGVNNKGAILFFDELNRANESVLAAGLGLALEGKVGGYILPSKVLVVAAGNRMEEVPGVTPIEPALSNRFAHVNLVTTYKNFEDYALTLGRDKIHPDILAFLQYAKEFFHRLDTGGGDGIGLAWPSPRSWEAASEEYLSIMKQEGRDLNKKEIIDIFTEHIGFKAASRFGNFIELKKHFSAKDLKDVYENPEKAKEIPKGIEVDGNWSNRPDLSRAIVLGIAFFKKDDKLTDKDIDSLFTYAMREPQVELAAALLGTIRKIHPYATKNKLWIQWLKKFQKHFKSELKPE